ncbi:MAG: cupin domain-containing protein [Gammaproteobacteria bacterium]|nr:cupin domain-containing protein [Gammaproteobacteria bacterium]
MIKAPGEGRPVGVPFHETTLLLSEADSPSEVSVYEFVVPPKSGGAPPHVHRNEDEYVYVLEGTLTLLVGEQTHEAVPGTLAALTRGTVHGFWNATNEPVKTLFFVSGGGFEQFFDAVARSLREQPPASVRDANARIDAIATRYEIELRPELIPEAAQPLYAPD